MHSYNELLLVLMLWCVGGSLAQCPPGTKLNMDDTYSFPFFIGCGGANGGSGIVHNYVSPGVCMDGPTNCQYDAPSYCKMKCLFGNCYSDQPCCNHGSIPYGGAYARCVGDDVGNTPGYGVGVYPYDKWYPPVGSYGYLKAIHCSWDGLAYITNTTRSVIPSRTAVSVICSPGSYQPIQATYLGCFKYFEKLGTHYISYGGFTDLADCTWKCARDGYMYAALTYGNCLCGSSYGMYGRSRELDCTFTLRSEFYGSLYK